MSSSVKCCILSSDLKSGGAERHLLQILNHWPESSWQFSLALLAHQGVWLNEIPHTAQLHALSERRPVGGLRQLVWAAQMAPRFRAVLSHGCDLVLTFLWLPTLVAALAMRPLRSAPPLVWSIQSDLEQAFRLRRTGDLRRWLVTNTAVPKVQHYIAITPGLSTRSQQLLNINSSMVSVIPNSIDTARIDALLVQPVDIPSKQAPIRIVSVGRLHPQKSMDVLLRAIATLHGQGYSLECYIIGEGEERLRLQVLTTEMGLDDIVNFPGYSANPYAWMQSADLFVLASSWEPFGIVLAEAMAVGLPIVTTDTDGAQAVIDPGTDGLITPVGDPDLLAKAISSLIDNPQLRRQFGERARRKARTFDAPVIAGQYKALLDDIVTRSHQ